MVTSLSTKLTQTSEKFALKFKTILLSSRLYCISNSLNEVSVKRQDFIVIKFCCIRRPKLYTELKTLSFLFPVQFIHNTNILNKNMLVFWKIGNAR